MKYYKVMTQFQGSKIGIWLTIRGAKKAKAKLKEFETKYPDNTNILIEM